MYIRKNGSLTPFILFTFMLTVSLVDILTSSAFANDKLGLVVGVPYAIKSPTKECFGAVLSPDGEHFYTLREKLLTRYRITPFEKTGTIVTEREELDKTQNESSCRVLLSNDTLKLVIVFAHKILLLNTKTGKILNKFESKHRGTGIVGAVLNGNELVILDREGGDSFHLFIRDANTLKLKREIRNIGKSFDFHPDQMYGAMSKIQDRIYLATGKSLLVLNRKTYDPELLALCKYTCSDPKVSKNFQKLYVWNVLNVTDYLNGNKTTYGDEMGDKVMVFDQETRKSKFENKNDISRIELDPILANRDQTSRASGYLVVSKGRSTAWAILLNLKTDTVFSFHQYDFGEAILMERTRGGKYKYFHLTPGARKYLMMKSRDNNIVPINDTTFDKYYRKR